MKGSQRGRKRGPCPGYSFLFFKYIYTVCVCVCMRVHECVCECGVCVQMPWCSCGGWRSEDNCGSWFSPSILFSGRVSLVPVTLHTLGSLLPASWWFFCLRSDVRELQTHLTASGMSYESQGSDSCGQAHTASTFTHRAILSGPGDAKEVSVALHLCLSSFLFLSLNRSHNMT